MKYVTYLIKPASSLCNLRCKYCFYQDEALNRNIKCFGVMNEETSLNVIKKGFEEVGEIGYISFAFQGGEPTVAGLSFFESFVKNVKQLKPRNVIVNFSIQTNGTLLDDNWCEFFSREHFLVGLSIDGYKELHNSYRIDNAGQETWSKVNRAWRLLKNHKVNVNVLCVVTSKCAKEPKKAYDSLKKLGFNFLQFIACLDPINQEKMEYSLSEEEYGRFLCDVFDLYYQDYQNKDYHSVRLFDDYIHALLGDNASTCATCGHCGGYFVVEGDGSIYPCDFFALDEWKVGNINEHSLKELRENEKYQEFLKFGSVKPDECISCKYKRLCNGGCKNDWIKIDDVYHNRYCKAFKKFFDYSYQRMRLIAEAEYAAKH